MARFSIFMLGESQITVSGGQQLDGVTQGDGSHLVGQTLTLNSNAWTEVEIRDNDTNFSDNDSNQRLDGSQNIDGTTYGNNTRVEAEYGLTVADGTSFWQMVGFNVNNSSPSYATIEGLAFVGDPGDFPPVGTPLTVVDAQEGPSFSADDYVTPICFTRGTWIKTATDIQRIEKIKVGDLIWTLDHGSQPVKWIGSRSVIAAGRFAPVEIPNGILGADSPVQVSQQHRLLISDPAAELQYGTTQVFSPAIALVDAGLARIVPAKTVEYFHILLENHDIIKANGVASESLYITQSAHGDDPDALFFPELNTETHPQHRLARPTLRRQEACALLYELTKIDRAIPLRHSA
ncbi:Hint domain-containing protein [Phaeobacter sp. NW0010-22]|uniref:Hint domain-containing protein n=1 Tax=Phaeobacter sp. NW0010-22 TaxID=3135907 RepID=UPI0031087437